MRRQKENFLLQAVSGDILWLRQLQTGTFSGRIHSVFERVINILGNDGELYSLTTTALDSGPLSLRLAPFPPVGSLGAGEAATLRNGLLWAGNWSVDFSRAESWRGQLPPFPAAAVLAKSLPVLADCICQQGCAGGMRDFLIPSESADVMSRCLAQRAGALLTALANGDWTAADAAVARLLGLGTGMTPSGDDFCWGLVTVMNMPHGPFSAAYRQFGERLAVNAAGRTTDLSAAMLRQAASGRVRERVLKLLQALAAGEEPVIRAAAGAVLEIGALSGTDQAVGIYAGLDLAVRRLLET